ncbi:choice-of-anchor L domain-containing protein [Pseudofulvibacter geojedonensis]|uniref:Choice-of-anchor L domain-containing protein n=1 Tax=Pseudofulvibacter geojedonensis TaxID=1123758 RepID=A0ABW3HZ85_9FLAO
MKTNIIGVILFLSVLFTFSDINAQATPTQGSSAAQLATQLSVNGGFTITSPVITNGGNRQRGLFSNGIAGAGLDIDSGIILTTGRVNRSINSQSSVQGDDDEQSSTQYNDVDLIAIDTKANYDVVIYEYDFTIAGTEPKIFALDYQFASEEYPDYVCSDKNDIFGFFISGGDLTGTTNIASVGGNNVAVNYVNNGTVGASGDAALNPCVLTNTSSFNVNYVMDDNGTPADTSDDFLDTATNGPHHMMYNGFTKLLRAYTILRPGITYHMKMAIADTNDAVYDSGIFIAPIQIFDLPPKSDIDFDGVDDYVNSSPFFGGFTGSTMSAWIKLSNGFSATGDVCGQDNFKLYVDGSRRLKTRVRTGSPTYTYTLNMEDSSPADGWIGYLQVRINGGAWMQFPIGGFPTDWLTTEVGQPNTSVTFEANPGDTIDLKYDRNGATNNQTQQEAFTLTVEDGTQIHNSPIGTNKTNNTWTYTATCSGCAPVTTIETPNGSAPVLQRDLWYHATTKFDGTTGNVTLFLNGSQVWQGTGLGANLNLKDDTSDFAVGRSSAGTNNYFSGAIDEVKVYNKALIDNQIREQIYQEVENVGGKVHGSTIPKDIDNGSINWSDLVLYYDMDLIYDITLIDNSGAAKNGFLNNITSVMVQTAPLPYVANASGDWSTVGTWQNGSVWDITSLPNKDWAIVQVTNNSKVTTTASHTHLGLLVDLGSELEVQNDQLLQNTSYLELDGEIDLVGESQLIQTSNSDLAISSSGYIERDQDGKSNLYHYNYWSSPVNPINTTANNTSYTVSDILRDGTTPSSPQAINWIAGYDGATGNPISLAEFWIFKFDNSPDAYANWTHPQSTGTFSVGQGFTLKGSGAATATQNYTFVGKPNNGVIQHSIGGNNMSLLGNPYASALDAHAFINDNIGGNPSTTGALYFWEHWGGNSHNLDAYEGGYSSLNLTGHVMAVSDPMVSSNGSGTIVPKRYIPVGQGFMVYGDSDGGTVEFNNGQRAFEKESGGNSTFVRASEEVSTSSTSEESIDRVYFHFTTPEGTVRQLLLGVKEGLTQEIDYGYDAKRFNEQHTDCGWKITEEPYVIQGIGLIHEGLELPLSINVGTSGLCKFNVSSLADLDENIDVYFKDSELQTETRLEQNIAAEFTLDTGVYNNRFSVVFRTSEILNIDDEEFTPEDMVVYYNAQLGAISINNSKPFNASNIKVYNILGQEVLKSNKQYQGVTELLLPTQVSSGSYLVQFSYNDKVSVTKKIIIK